MPLRTLLFDLGNVLVHFSHERMHRQIAAVCRSEPAIIRGMLEQGLQAEFECGRLSSSEFHIRLQEGLATRVEIGDLLHAGADIFEPNEPLLQWLPRLKAQGKRLVLLSNTNAAHFEHIQTRFTFLSLFDDLVLSYRVGAMKPAPQIFAAALRSIDCAPRECLYVDDIAEYVAAGQGWGLRGHVFRGVDEFAADLARHERKGCQEPFSGDGLNTQ